MRKIRLLVAACLLLGGVQFCNAATFYVSGINGLGDTLSGTIEADPTLTTVSALNLSINNSISLTSIDSYISPGYISATINTKHYQIYLSYAGGPTPGDIAAGFAIGHQAVEDQYASNCAACNAYYDPSKCGGDLSCEAYVQGENSICLDASMDVRNAGLALVDARFSAVAVAVDPPGQTPLPASAPLFSAGLGAVGLLAYKRKRRRTA